MPLTEDTNSGYSDPLEAPPLEEGNNNIERVEHAPDGGKNSEDQDNGDRLYLWLSLLVGIVGAAIIIVVILVAGGDDDDDGAATSRKPLYDLPLTTFAPIAQVDDRQTQLNMIREAVEAEPVTKAFLDKLPTTIADLEVEFVQDNTDPVLRAAAWVVLEDDYNAENQIVERFALATIYFGTGGLDWIMTDGWMTSANLCEWYGITCCAEYFQGSNVLCTEEHPDHLSLLDLNQNNLQGPFPEAFALLKDLHSLQLSWNSLRGPLDGSIIAAMPNLRALFLQHNQLNGTFDTKIVDNGVLDTFYVQGNFFDGGWPVEYCSQLLAFNFDCNRNACPGACCTTTEEMHECTDLTHTYNEELGEEGAFGA